MDEDAELVRMALAKGATAAEVDAAVNVGELILDYTLRPRSETTLREVVDGTGLGWPEAERLLTATGLPIEPDRFVTDDEAETIRLLVMVRNELLGEDVTIQLGRVAGAAMARVAEALVAAFRLRFELPRQAQGMSRPQVVEEYAAVAQTILPSFVGSLDVLLRQQILAVAARVWSTDEERSVVTLPRAVGFADIVGYTAAAATQSWQELSGVLIAFDEITATAALRGRGQIVKTIGDEAMFAAEDPADACRIALDIVERFGAGGLPPVRVGIAFGDVVSMFGDLYGPDVNLAARLVAAAEPSTVVVSDAVARRAGEALVFESLEPLVLKGFAEPVPACRLLGRRL